MADQFQTHDASSCTIPDRAGELQKLAWCWVIRLPAVAAFQFTQIAVLD
jgi:hypothetical protein